MTIIITGAAGYIGGQIALQLNDAGHRVLGIDCFPMPKHLKGIIDFVRHDVDSDTVMRVIADVKPKAIIHCAGTSLVGPSMTTPADYYQNNFIKTKRLLDTLLVAAPQARFCFSSSAAVYGNPKNLICWEHDPCEPISPYGQSKLMIEWMLQSYHHAYGLDYVTFRYFNACGADPQARHGQAQGATHIMARILESVVNNQEFVLNGEDYDTPDGTCIRDYVHVDDIARAHVQAIVNRVPAGVYNLGSNQGHSNREIIAAVERVVQRPVTVRVSQPRVGDPAILTADATKFTNLMNWRKWELDDMIQHAWAWYVRKHS